MLGRGERGWRWAASGLLAGAMGLTLLACADNKGPDEERGTTTDTTAGDAPAEQQAATSTATVAPTQAPRPVGTDADYVRGLCVGMDQFFRDVETATHTITPTDPAGVAREFAKAFGPPLARFAEKMEQTPPPADVQAWHDIAVTDLEEIAGAIEAGEGLNEIARLGDRPLPDLPDDIQQRITTAAAAVPECAQFEDAFGG